MAGTAASLELRWGGLFRPIPRRSAGEEWSGNHRGEPRHRVSGSRVIVVVTGGLGVRLPGVFRLGVVLFRWWQGCRNPEERGVG